MSVRSNLSFIPKILFSLAFLFLSPQGAFAAVACEQVFSDSNPDLSSAFIHNTAYKVVVPEVSPVKNQCASAACPIYTWASILESSHSVMNHGDQLKISTQYPTIQLWIRSALETLRSPDDNVQPASGSNAIATRNLFLIHGIVPHESWAADSDFQNPEKFRQAKKSVVKVISWAKTARAAEADPYKRARILSIAEEKIQRVIIGLTGKLPEKFKFRGLTYTPLSFREKFFPELDSPMIFLSADRSENPTARVLEVKGENISLRAPIADLEQTTKDLIDRGLGVYLSFEMDSRYIDDATGIMSTKAFKLLKYSLPKIENHAVEVIGYDFDPATNKIIKWKIKNSWGTKKGQEGIYHMYADYFDQKAISITFFKDSGVEIPGIQQK